MKRKSNQPNSLLRKEGNFLSSFLFVFFMMSKQIICTHLLERQMNLKLKEFIDCQVGILIHVHIFLNWENYFSILCVLKLLFELVFSSVWAFWQIKKLNLCLTPHMLDENLSERKRRKFLSFFSVLKNIKFSSFIKKSHLRNSKGLKSQNYKITGDYFSIIH